LCAEAIAAELCRPLVLAQVPALLSQWVGGTENRLKDLFDGARADGAVLLLDECDALLLDRGGAHHRHEVSLVTVLLGLLERHDGVVLLATNRPQALDKALARRVGWSLAFPIPDSALRARIWRGLLPATVPGADSVDTARLGRKYPLAGGHIRNAVFRAALRAADRGTGIDQALLEAAASEELLAAGGVEESSVVREVAEG
ncbi:MAG: AAA family ATPase, partial [Gammaproteobacteria bacterium]|nr:AAA family ATPase [Gammaproteobacteria bacterium]